MFPSAQGSSSAEKDTRKSSGARQVATGVTGNKHHLVSTYGGPNGSIWSMLQQAQN